MYKMKSDGYHPLEG